MTKSKILHKLLLVTRLLLIIAIIFFYYTKQRPNKKKYWHTKNVNIENKELKKVCVKNRTRHYFDDMIKGKDCNLLIFY